MRCEGYRRYGGAFSFGPVKWEQCKNEAISMITVVQNGNPQTLPACPLCWQECIDSGIEITDATPIVAEAAS